MDLGLRGRTAIVGGASSGLGLACAQALAEEGANVVAFARRGELLEREAERIGAVPVVADVREPADLERVVQTAVERFGGVDVLVPNSGGPPPSTATELDADSVQSAVDLLLKPVVRLVGLALPHLLASDQGRIVLIASLAVREPTRNLALTNSVRPGVVGYMKSLATELGPRGITVNSVGPGRLATARMQELYGDGPPAEELRQIPVGRLGDPRELGDLVAFLCSSRASYITGTLIQVDGGLARSLL
ncbi:MAG TPA: SDR family oxidoreductase [Gaiellaceae bacterium]|nr:SDR family oxidoreductase [Gaiellaceae bacterium]